MKANNIEINSSGKRLYLKLILLLILSLPLLQLRAQDAYVCNNGKIHFFSPSVAGDVDAVSSTAVCIITKGTNKVVAKVKQTSFSFKHKLMEEHFNENYMESDKYPYAVLDMQITSPVDYTRDGTVDVTLKGTLEMHGVKVERQITGKLVIKNGEPVNATATFVVSLADHHIKIPSIVGAHITDNVKVDVEFNFEKYKKT